MLQEIEEQKKTAAASRSLLILFLSLLFLEVNSAPFNAAPTGPHVVLASSMPNNQRFQSLYLNISMDVENYTSLAQGWTSEPATRGTIDIIWSSGTTIFLCCCTALCLNVPPQHWSRWRRLLQKVLMACLGLIGPEFIFQLALGQWISARRSVEQFKSSGYSQWTIRHAFLADMGGFVLEPPDWVPFPINAGQLHYLVSEGYILYDDVALDEDAIREKNRGDGIARFIAVFQILWFCINCLGRVVQGLAITTLELSTLGFILCTLGTYYFWAYKPKDVGQAIILTLLLAF